MIIKQAPEDSTAALEIQQRDVKLFTLPQCHLLLFKACRGTNSFLSKSYIVAYVFLVCVCVFIKVLARPFSNGSNAHFGSASKSTYF